MDHKSRPDSGRLIALTMIGAGLIALGIMLMMLFNLPKNDPSASSTDLSAVPAKVNYPAPQLDLVTLEGKPVSLADYLGDVVLVNLWATWCPPCRQEMPTLQTFYNHHKEEGFVMLGINQEETREVVQPFVEEYGITFPVWLDKDYLAQREFHTANLPSSYVIDRKGQVRLLWIGSISAKNLDESVPDLILE